MKTASDEYQKLDLRELEDVAGGMDISRMSFEEQKHLMALHKAYYAERRKVGSDAYDWNAVAASKAEMDAFVDEMKKKYGEI